MHLKENEFPIVRIIPNGEAKIEKVADPPWARCFRRPAFYVLEDGRQFETWDKETRKRDLVAKALPREIRGMVALIEEGELVGTMTSYDLTGKRETHT